MTEQKIVPFLFEGEQMVRVVEREGDPWFVLADVCATIGLSNPTMAAAPLDEDEKSTLSLTEGGPDRIIISEGGLYTLVLRSRDAMKQGSAAHRFRRWVTSEVVPSIRRAGRYVASATPIDDDEPQTPDALKLRKVNTAARCFGERAGAQLWTKLGLDWVPAMAATLSQGDLLDGTHPPGSVTITVSPAPGAVANGSVR